ncbi:polyketide biosynthesis enoyl-CoA hydratase [bacterium BMS3Bbin01]|nr:polyketide biosynthesis enoyl-CoA hydratase [bacterium BMS3Bbin01]
MTTAHRYGGAEAAGVGIVERAVSEEDVLPAAIEMAAALAEKDPATLQAIKQGMYASVVAALAR